MNATRRTALTALAALACSALAPRVARADAIDDALARIEAARTRVRTFVADFEQERTMGLFGQTLRAQGRLAVQRPDRVRWEVLTPSAGVFVVAHGRVAYRVGSSQASASQSQVGPLGAVLADLAAFLGGPLRPLRARYRIEVDGAPDGALTLRAVPQDATVARAVSRVLLRFRPDLQAIDWIYLEEPGDDRTHIVLRNVHLNAPVDPRAFVP